MNADWGDEEYPNVKGQALTVLTDADRAVLDELRAEMAAVGLEGHSVASLIKHHRANAKLIGAAEMYESNQRDRAVLDAAEELIEADKFGGPGEYGYALMALTRAVDALVAARREAQ